MVAACSRSEARVNEFFARMRYNPIVARGSGRSPLAARNGYVTGGNGKTMQNQPAIPVSTSPDGRRSAPRYALRLAASGAAAEQTFSACVRSISTTGLALEAEPPLTRGIHAEIDLPGNGPTAFTVVWQNGDLSGCAFDAPIPASVVSATRLKGYPESGEISVSVPMLLTAERRRWRGTVRLAIAIGAGLGAWAIAIGGIAALI